MRRLLAPAVAVLACVAVPQAALGATVGNAVPTRLDFRAGPGEANRVTLELVAGQFVVTDLGVVALSVEGSCTLDPGDVRRALCPAAGVVELDFAAGNLDDQLTNTTGLGGVLLGEDGNDSVQGGAGDERLDGGAGADVLDGGGGRDALYGATIQDAEAGTDGDRLTGGAGEDRLFGSGGVDTLDGGPDNDRLAAGGGNDDVRGGEGDDEVVGGGGDDVQDGGPGNDTIGSLITTGAGQLPPDAGNDVLRGGPGGDVIIPGFGPPFADADAISGGEGRDEVTYARRLTQVLVSAGVGADDGDMVERDDVGDDVERIVGGAAGDVLRGSPGDDTIDGGPGDDRIEGLAGNDTLNGDAGSAAGADVILGGSGNDTIAGEDGGDNAAGEAGNDTVAGGGGADTVAGGTGVDSLQGGAGQDVASYSEPADVTVRLDAGTGGSAQPGDADTLAQVENITGGGQRDTVTGDSGANVLDGAAQEDYIDGAGGVDRLSGGDSADVIAARDSIKDEPVACGPGRDLAIVDRSDPVVRSGPQGCEDVDTGEIPRPRAGSVHVGVPRCGASGAAALDLPTMSRSVPLRYALTLDSGFRGRPAPTVDPGGCELVLTAAVASGRDASAVVSGGVVAIEQVRAERRTVATVLAVQRPSCGLTATSRRQNESTMRVRVTTRRKPGGWRVRGRYSIGATEGTDWTTVEGCRSTTTIVRRGRVKVYDRVKRRSVTVSAGERYVARAARRG